MNYTFISGATGGLGTAFAKQCASQKENLFLTGRSKDKLKLLQDKIEQKYPDISVKIFPCSLEKEESRNLLFSYVEENKLIFSRLINVAGVDIQKAFSSYTQEKVIFQTRVNFESACALSLFVLSHRADALSILTISSVSAIYPMPYFALYSATKSALIQFFSALRVELKEENVKVTTVLPGAIPTRNDIKEQIKGQGLWGKLAAKSPEFVAKKSLNAVKKNKRIFIPGFWNKLMKISTFLLPMKIKMRFIAKRWSKIEKDAF